MTALPELMTAIRDELGDGAGLRLVVLYGSQARGDAHQGSDVDLAVLADPSAAEPVDIAGLTARLVARLGTEAVDVADLARASGLLRLRVAQDGVPIVEASRGAFVEFQISACQFWCDVEPVVRAAHEQVLDSLTP